MRCPSVESKAQRPIARLDYYWPTMIADAMQYTKQCQAYQILADLIYQPPELLHTMVTSWPFKVWGIMS